MNIEKNKNIIVYIEISEKSPINASLEALSQAKKLSEETGDKIIAFLFGQNLNEAIEQCKQFGADEIIFVNTNEKGIEIIGKTFIKLKEKYSPNVIILGGTLDGKDLASILAADSNLPAFVNVIDMKYVDNKYLITVPIYGGNIFREVSSDKYPIIVGLRSGACKKEINKSMETNVIEEKLEDNNTLTKVVEIVKEISENINLEEAEVIVTGGRGVGSKENFELIKNLATACGGVVGATRPVTEENWLPRSYQIGQSGKIVSPKLYIACGVSGATQHLSGVMGSDYIIAINKDEDAPIFEVADIGVVGNLLEILPILTNEIEKLKKV